MDSQNYSCYGLSVFEGCIKVLLEYTHSWFDPFLWLSLCPVALVFGLCALSSHLIPKVIYVDGIWHFLPWGMVFPLAFKFCIIQILSISTTPKCLIYRCSSSVHFSRFPSPKTIAIHSSISRFLKHAISILHGDLIHINLLIGHLRKRCWMVSKLSMQKQHPKSGMLKSSLSRDMLDRACWIIFQCRIWYCLWSFDRQIYPNWCFLLRWLVSFLYYQFVCGTNWIDPWRGGCPYKNISLLFNSRSMKNMVPISGGNSCKIIPGSHCLPSELMRFLTSWYCLGREKFVGILKCGSLGIHG